jgi:hypothetical protein
MHMPGQHLADVTAMRLLAYKALLRWQYVLNHVSVKRSIMAASADAAVASAAKHQTKQLV